MSGVKFPLTIGFYDESGLRVDATDMELCTAAATAAARATARRPRSRTAVETPKGKLPEGPLTACPAA